MDYVHGHYANPSYYWMDQGAFVIGYFGACSDFSKLKCPGDWEAIWGTVSSYVNSHNYNFKFIFNFGNFSTPSVSDFQAPAITAGEYGWPQPIVYNPTGDTTTQFCWGNNSQTPNCTQYLDTLYCDTVHGSGCTGQWSGSGQITVGVLYKGFDDTKASWSQDKVIAQQCGQVLIDTAAEMAKYFANQNQYTLPYVQVATWNDYEEGTEAETGINNCYTVTNAYTANGSLNWSLTASDPTYANLDTIHHFTIWWATVSDPNQRLTVAATNIQPSGTTMSIPLSQLNLPHPAPDYMLNLYIEMVGQPLIVNQMSTAVEYTEN